jgi:hypothetical protein
MKKGFLSFAAFVMALVAAPQAHAIVGGPFDNGDYSSILDDNGIYQASFRFKNGSGFAQFGTNVSIQPYIDPTAGGGSTVPNTAYSVLNRSVFYYKGLTFLGTATGIVDHERKSISGYTNGNSDVTSSATTSTSSFFFQNSTTSASNSLLNNGGTGMPCNSQWQAKITSSRPILRFSGEGELTVINPSLQQLAFQGLERIINDYDFSPAVQTSGDGQTLIEFITLGEQIQDLVNGIQIADSAGDTFSNSLDSIRDSADVVKMQVFGSRQFFLGTR